MQKYRKPYRIKRKKPFFRNRFFWLSISFLLFIGGIFYLICFVSFFQIKEIKILGNQKISAANLENIVKENITKNFLFFNSKSIFLLDKNKIKSELSKTFPQIEKEDLKRELPNTLILEIEEKKEIGCFCRNEICFFIDKKGVIFEKVSQTCPLSLIIKDSKEEEISFGQKIVEENILLKIQEIQQKLKESLQITTSEFNISEEKLIVKTLDGWEIYFNPEKDINLQLNKLEPLLESEIPPEKRGNLEYIDLRFSKIFWKFR